MGKSMKNTRTKQAGTYLAGVKDNFQKSPDDVMQFNLEGGAFFGL